MVSAATMIYAERDRLPVSALLALALAGFITIVTEALPAGLLPQIGNSLNVSVASAGQLVTVYALGSLLTAIPLTAATRSLRRRPLLLTAIAGFFVANTVTALSDNYALTMAARLIAGVSAGLLWALIAGYAARMVQPSLKGRAIALAMVGTPLALALGVPLGTLVGESIGWRSGFLVISLISVLLAGWVMLSVPDFPGQPAAGRRPVLQVLTLPGIRPILAATLAFVLAHNILYTYIAPFLLAAQMGDRIGTVLLIFGVTSLLGIWGTGLMVDRWLRRLTLGSTLLFAAAALALGLARSDPLIIYLATAAWGVAFGGAPTLFQTALANAAGEAADVAQSMLVTAWNLAIAGGGLAGGLILTGFGPALFSPTLALILVLTWPIVWRARRGFPD